MPTALDAPAAALDEGETEFVRKIREFGWHRTTVLADDEHAGFVYTTGFWVNLGAPEFILFSLKSEIAGAVLHDVYKDARDGRRLPLGVRLDDVFGNAPAYVFEVDRAHYAEHLGWSRWFYGNDGFPCHQLIWPDREGRFPWELGFDEVFRADQPDLTASGWANELAG